MAAKHRRTSPLGGATFRSCRWSVSTGLVCHLPYAVWRCCLPSVWVRYPVLDVGPLGIRIPDRSFLRRIDLDIPKQVAYANDTLLHPSLYLDVRGCRVSPVPICSRLHKRTTEFVQNTHVFWSSSRSHMRTLSVCACSLMRVAACVMFCLRQWWCALCV